MAFKIVRKKHLLRITVLHVLLAYGNWARGTSGGQNRGVRLGVLVFCEIGLSPLSQGAMLSSQRIKSFVFPRLNSFSSFSLRG